MRGVGPKRQVYGAAPAFLRLLCKKDTSGPLPILKRPAIRSRRRAALGVGSRIVRSAFLRPRPPIRPFRSAHLGGPGILNLLGFWGARDSTGSVATESCGGTRASPGIRDLEESLGQDHMRVLYKRASHKIHAMRLGNRGWRRGGGLPISEREFARFEFSGTTRMRSKGKASAASSRRLAFLLKDEPISGGGLGVIRKCLPIDPAAAMSLLIKSSQKQTALNSPRGWGFFHPSRSSVGGSSD